MEIISFEKRTFEEIAAKLDRFVQRVESLCREHAGKILYRASDIDRTLMKGYKEAYRLNE